MSSELLQPMLTQRPPNAPPAFHLLAKPTGAICNLDCAYCFFLDKEVLYPGSKFRMSEPVLEQYVRQLIEAHQTNDVNIAWQGGEPTLMGLDFYRRVLVLVEKYRRPGMNFLHTMQTNGTLLNDEWAAFFKEHNFLIGISIDGPRVLHDAYRVDKGGKPTFDNVMRGLRLLQKHGVDFNVLTTVNRANADFPLEVYRFLPRRGRDDLDAVHSGGGAHQQRWLDAPAGGNDGVGALGAGGAVRALPHRHLRRMGAPRRRNGLRADLRGGAAQLAGDGVVGHVRLQRNLRHRAGDRA